MKGENQQLGQEPLIASLLLVAMPFAPSSFLLLVVRPGAPSSVLAPSQELSIFSFQALASTNREKRLDLAPE